MKKMWFRALKFASLSVVIYILGQLAQLLSVLFIEANGGTPLTSWQTTIAIASYLVIILVTLWLGLRYKVINLSTKLSLKRLALLAGAGEPALFVVTLVGVLILLAMGDDLVSVNQAAINDLITVLPPILLFVMIVIGAPIIEETIFRGFIPKLFDDKRQWAGLVLGAILFGLAHYPTNPGSAVQYIGMGAVLSAVTYFGKRLEYSIILHAVHNAIGFLALLSQ